LPREASDLRRSSTLIVLLEGSSMIFLFIAVCMVYVGLFGLMSAETRTFRELTEECERVEKEILLLISRQKRRPSHPTV